MPRKFLTSTVAAGFIVTGLFGSAAMAQSGASINALNPGTTLTEAVLESVAAVELTNTRLARETVTLASRKAYEEEQRRISANLAARVSAFDLMTADYQLVRSSTLDLGPWAQAREAYEQTYTDGQGHVVTVRVFGEDDDMNTFLALAADDDLLSKHSLRLVDGHDHPMVKRDTMTASLSVLAMSEADHALIEVTGDNEAAVMAFVDAVLN